jgi:signal transduction histidine kinase
MGDKIKYYKRRFSWHFKIMVVLATLIILLIIFFISSFKTSDRLSYEASNFVSFEIPRISIGDDLKQKVAFLHIQVMNYLMIQDSFERKMYLKEINLLENQILARKISLKKLLKDEKDFETFAFIELQENRYMGFYQEFLFKKRDFDYDDVNNLYLLQKYYNLYRIALNRITKKSIEKASENAINLENDIKRSTIFNNALVAIALIVVLFAGYYLLRLLKKLNINNERLLLQINERKRVEDEILKYSNELKNKNKSMNRLISVLSHDLRSPANSLVGSAKFLNENISSLKMEDVERFSHIIHSSSLKLVDQLNNLLQWVKAQSVQEREIFDPVVLCVYDEVKKVVDLLSDTAEQKKINIINLVKAYHYVKADNHLFQSIIQNLISNALKFTPEKGRITIKSAELQDKIEISVGDTGVGMSQQVIDSLFKGGDYTSEGTAHEKGSGLGLNLVKEFVEKQGGEVAVQSKPGKGTIFTITLSKAH